MRLVERRPDAEVQAEIAGNPVRLDKVQTAVHDRVLVKGVPVSSRWGKADELDPMVELIWALEPWKRALLKEVWCDSQPNHDYHLIFRMRPNFERSQIYAGIARLLREICLRTNGGFNGIWLEHNGKVFAELSAEWEGER